MKFIVKSNLSMQPLPLTHEVLFLMLSAILKNGGVFSSKLKVYILLQR